MASLGQYLPMLATVLDQVSGKDLALELVRAGIGSRSQLTPADEMVKYYRDIQQELHRGTLPPEPPEGYGEDWPPPQWPPKPEEIENPAENVTAPAS